MWRSRAGAGRSLVLASVVLTLVLAAPARPASAVALQTAGAGRQSGVSGGVDPGMPETIDPGPGPSAPASSSDTAPPGAGGGGPPVSTGSTLAASGTGTPAQGGATAGQVSGPGAAATTPPPSATSGTSAAVTTSPSPSPEPAAAEATSTSGDPVPDGVAGDGELEGRSTGASSGPVESPTLLLVGLAMALGGMAFLAVRNRRTGTFRPIQ